MAPQLTKCPPPPLFQPHYQPQYKATLKINKEGSTGITGRFDYWGAVGHICYAISRLITAGLGEGAEYKVFLSVSMTWYPHGSGGVYSWATDEEKYLDALMGAPKATINVYLDSATLVLDIGPHDATLCERSLEKTGRTRQGPLPSPTSSIE